MVLIVVEYGNDGGCVEDGSGMVKGITICALCGCRQLHLRAYGNIRRRNKKEQEIIVPQ